MRVELKTITPNAELNIVEIARVSSSRKDKTEKPEGLINYLVKNSHWSPLEHSYITFEIVTSKAIGIQLLRHRSFTFQEFSQRYAIVDSFEPIEFRRQAETNRQSSVDSIGTISIDDEGWDYVGDHDDKTYNLLAKSGDLLVRIQELYVKMLAAGVARECARMILPMCTETTIFMTGNIRSWLGFLNIRLDHHAQKEIVDISIEIAKIFKQELPIITKATNDFNEFKGMFM